MALKKLIYLSLFLLLVDFTYAQKVFSVDYESRADVKVFVVDYESRADLLVYKVDYESRAGKNDGKWFSLIMKVGQTKKYSLLIMKVGQT